MASVGTSAVRSSGSPSAAWVDSEQAWLGWGIAEERVATTFDAALALAAELARSGEGQWFGGLAFPTATQSSEWVGFPAARFIRPAKISLLPREDLVRAVCAGSAAVAPEAMANSWSELVSRATGELAAHRFEKVVLARAASQRADQPVDAWAVFQALCGTASAKRHFFFCASDGAAFLGASPETLVRWRDGQLELDALAGSAPPGAAFTEKERREHDVVVRDVLNALEPLTAALASEPTVMELPYVRHLHTPIRAATDAGFDFGRLLRRLFPTSAVAGAPRDAALEFIAQHEGFDRGWYSGAVGRISKGSVDLAVALRCLLVRERTATLFAGAGIVVGSQAESEWAETARKMRPAERAWRDAQVARGDATSTSSAAQTEVIHAQR